MGIKGGKLMQSPCSRSTPGAFRTLEETIVTAMECVREGVVEYGI